MHRYRTSIATHQITVEERPFRRNQRSRLVPPKAPGDLFGGGNNAQRGDAFCGIDALDDSNELDIVFRRTMDYNPSLTSISSTESSSRTPSVANASRASLIRPDY
ncbi:hypothetical protein EV182_006729, partial [Spiromyces aspiralis]